MRRGRPLTRLVIAGSVVMLCATGCFGPGDGSTANGSLKVASNPGGTLNLLMSSDFAHLDPARNYDSTSLNFGRLIYRTLTTYKAESGKAGNEVVGDLATDTGTPSDGGRTWSFTLRPGLKYEDGTAITAADVKYGIERAFDPALPGGPQYFQLSLANVPAGYPGPKKAHGKRLDSIIVAGNKITFKLKKPFPDFSFAAAMPTTAPVPLARDSGAAYDRRPFSSGPYKIARYDRGKTLTLTRNAFWDKATDVVRKAYPDEVDCTFGIEPSTIDQRLIADSGQDRAALAFDTTLGPDSIPQALSSPAVRARTISGLDGYLLFLAINTARVKDVRVRQAINYAVNKESYRTARGGKYAGEYASTILTPLVPGHLDFDLYKAPPRGDPEKAKQLLQQAGVKTPLRLTMASPSVGKGVTQAVAVQAALSRAGIEVTIQAIPPDSYLDTVGTAAKMPDLAFSNRGPDWPSGSTVLPPMFDGRQIKAQGNSNMSMLNVPAINAEMDRINAITDPKAQAPEWGKLDEQIMMQAPIVPLIYNAGIHLRGSQVVGGYLHAYYGQWDLVSLAVK
ncbi:MAG: ABC transporter substrate-binding protein [Mycobacteriales bacterium]